MRSGRLQGAAGLALLLMSSITPQALPIAYGQQAQPQTTPTQVQAQSNPSQPAPTQSVQTDTTGTPGLPQAPVPTPVGPLFLRDTAVDYTRPKSHIWNPIAPYTATDFDRPRLSNSPRMNDLLRDGKIYLSLPDAITLAMENNYDIAIARINLDIADTDLLRAKAGGTLRGVSTGLVTNTIGGTSTTISGGGGPGGTTTSAGGSSTGASGLVLSTNGGGPATPQLDPTVTGTLQLERARTPQSTTFITGTNTLSQNTDSYNFGYNQGFLTGTSLALTFNNSRTTTNSTRSNYSPQLQSVFQAKVQQHLLQGFGWGLNSRFIVQARNDRRITDSAFRQQLIYTITQIESIYWSLVSAYEDVQAKQRALDQSTKLASDNRKQLEIGTLAPLDVVNSDSTVATDKQSLITSQSNLEYQQLVMKQAIARNLNDPQLSAAPVIPTDRVSLERLPEEDLPVEELVRQSYANNPSIEQAVLNMQNNEITKKALRNGLLPTVDVYGFYGASALGGSQNRALLCSDNTTGQAIPCGVVVPTQNYGSVFQNLFNSSNPDKGVGLSVSIPLRNRVAQADQARSQMEYRQSEMRLQQIYTQTRIQVINAQYALTNDRASVEAAQVARDFQAQSLDAEEKKYRLGASTTANVLQQQRNLATAENNLISATAAYAKDRTSLQQLLANTLDRYGISLAEATNGTIQQKPIVPGLTAPKPPAPPKPLTAMPDSAAPTAPSTNPQ